MALIEPDAQAIEPRNARARRPSLHIWPHRIHLGQAALLLSLQAPELVASRNPNYLSQDYLFHHAMFLFQTLLHSGSVADKAYCSVGDAVRQFLHLRLHHRSFGHFWTWPARRVRPHLGGPVLAPPQGPSCSGTFHASAPPLGEPEQRPQHSRELHRHLGHQRLRQPGRH